MQLFVFFSKLFLKVFSPDVTLLIPKYVAVKFT